MNAAPDCIVAADARGVIIEFNPAAEWTFGRARGARDRHPFFPSPEPPRYDRF